MMTTLSDLGERRILAEIIPQYATGTGDDCAELPVTDGTLTVTMDPVPRPAAAVIAGDEDPYWMGWLLVTINASDVAASGGRPRAFLSALDLPRDWPVANLHRLLTGIRDACDGGGFAYIGGNIREALTLAATGVAIGECVGYAPLARSGAKAGDVILSVGQGGQFWCDAMYVRGGGSVPAEESPLFKPKAQSTAMWMLAEAGLLSSAMDTSDGFLPTLIELAQKSSAQFVVETTRLQGHVDRASCFLDGPRCWFGWGDWTVVATAPAEHVERIQEIATAAGTVVREIGTVAEGPPAALLRRDGHEIPAPRLESERFAADSWFHVGIDRYVENMLATALP